MGTYTCFGLYVKYLMIFTISQRKFVSRGFMLMMVFIFFTGVIIFIIGLTWSARVTSTSFPTRSVFKTRYTFLLSQVEICSKLAIFTFLFSFLPILRQEATQTFFLIKEGCKFGTVTYFSPFIKILTLFQTTTF